MTDSIKQRDLIDALRRVQDDFDKDFSLRDITTDLHRYIKKKELMEINGMSDEKQKIDKLIFTFIYIRKDIWPLLLCLQSSYEWLYQAIVNAKKSDKWKWIEDYRKAIKDIPYNQDWNIHRTKYLWEIQQNLKKLQRNHYLILFGKLGFGKRWLAADACRDFSVVRKMNYKIFWLNVSKCCTQELILEKMHRLKVLLQADDLDIKYNTYSGNTKNEIIHMRNYLRKILEQPEFHDCLIVLTDVQDDNIIKAFDLNCKMFITTRHIEKLENIPKESKTTIDIETGFEEDESTELFTKAFDNALPVDMTEYIGKFHNTCSGHPFIMSIIAKTFQNFKENEKMRSERCKNWLKNLEQYDLKDDDIQLKMSMEESMKFLDVRHQICYKKMSIFADNSEIPFKVLEKIWDTDEQQTEAIVVKFHKYSLIERPSIDDQSKDKVCSLHYLHFHFLKQHVSESEQRDFHRHLIDKYEVRKILRDRTELDLDFPEDNYFHYFIPYHLVGAEMEDLFDLYLDFGFLEQKMRLTKLCNTVGDLIRFETKITRNEPEREVFLTELIDFLTNCEQLIFKSKDVNLLQCALTSFGSVQMMAKQQTQKYQDRVWMNDLNHEENQTQIVQLSGNSHPQIVRFVKPNDILVCLISLQDNNILLHDISQDYLDDPVLYRNELPSVITDMQVFRNHAFLTLNDMGKLCIYTLKNNQNRRVSGPSRANLVNSNHNKVIQFLENASDKITCFNVFETQQDSAQQVDLIVGTSKGNIKFYQWKGNKFEENKVKLKTSVDGLFRMAHILHQYLMLLNNNGDIQFINLIDSGRLATNCKLNRLESPINLHQGTCIHTKKPVSLCVSKSKVVQVTHNIAERVYNVIFLDCDDVFVAKDDFAENEILSSTMSKDAEYLILGTTKGIIVIDRFEKKVIFRRNVSDQVLSLDIYRYHDEAMYILSSVFKDAGHVISLHGFNGNRDELAMVSNDMTLLVGEDLFDIKKSSDEWKMVAIDNKRNIHYRSSAKDFTESIEKNAFEYHVKKISYNGDKVIVGCTNGSVFALDEFSQTTLLADLRSEITYLECFDGAVIVSCNSVFKIIGIDNEFMGKVTKAYRYNENELLLIKKNCAIEIVNLSTGEVTLRKDLARNDSTSAQAYRDSIVAIATEQNNIYLWKVNEGPETSDIRMMEVMSPVTSLAISPDNNVLAVGYLNGNIEIVDLVIMKSIQMLESHKRAIMNLQFSPWSDPNDPLILLSLSESVIFWNIRSVQNNPLVRKHKESASSRVRVSQRFPRKSPLKLSPSPSDSTLLFPTQNLSLNESISNPWRKKTGASEKPELLSCIKLVAKSAKRIICDEDFTRFVTIDNEGNIYHLRLIRESSENQLTIDWNGNPMQIIQ